MKTTTSQIAGAVTAFCTSIGAIIVGVYCGIHMGRFESYTACVEKGTITYPPSILLDNKARAIDCAPRRYAP